MSTKITTGTVRLSYVNAFTPRAASDGAEPKYSVCLLIPKKDKKTLAQIKAAVEEAKKEGASEKWKGKIPANLKMPLRDGDEERADERPEFKGMWFLNATGKRPPIILDENKDELLDATELYSGCWARVNLTFYPYDVNGNRGIAAGLNAIQKRRDDETLEGTLTVEAAAAAFDDDDEDDGDMLD